MTNEEKFLVDLEGYLVIKDVLTPDELAELNKIIDQGDRSGHPTRWGAPFKSLIDHPKILPYLIELLGPKFRLDHDYAIFMSEGENRGRLHGGEDGGSPGGPEGDHWYKYRDGVIRNELIVMTYCLSDVGERDGGFSCVPGSHKSNFATYLPTDVRSFDRPAHYVVQPAAKAGDVIFFTEAVIHGTMPWRAAHERRSLLYKYSPGHSAWSGHFYDLSKFGELTDQQKRIMSPPSIGDRPNVIQDEMN